MDLLNSLRFGAISCARDTKDLVQKTNGQIDEFKPNQLDTEMHGRLYKKTISGIMRDRFGAKNPKHRNAIKRCLYFDRIRIKDFLIEYTKESSPTKICCSLVNSDLSDRSDTIFKPLG